MRLPLPTSADVPAADRNCYWLGLGTLSQPALYNHVAGSRYSGQNVLYGDGHVTWSSTAKHQVILPVGGPQYNPY